MCDHYLLEGTLLYICVYGRRVYKDTSSAPTSTQHKRPVQCGLHASFFGSTVKCTEMLWVISRAGC
ncbi:UNVERIFIED_CONTAM: hypothetical protein FKN15_013034 [Acipenser sinensis]